MNLSIDMKIPQACCIEISSLVAIGGPCVLGITLHLFEKIFYLAFKFYALADHFSSMSNILPFENILMCLRLYQLKSILSISSQEQLWIKLLWTFEHMFLNGRLGAYSVEEWACG